VAGVKAFLGSSTGSLLLDKEVDILAALMAGRRRLAVHSEDEARLRARAKLAMPGDPRTHPLWRDVETARISTERVLKLARAASRRLHMLHVTTTEELPLIAAARDLATSGGGPHLTLAAPVPRALAPMPKSIRRSGTRGIAKRWRQWRRVWIDVVGSIMRPYKRGQERNLSADAPRAPVFKPRRSCSSRRTGRLSLERFADLTARVPRACSASQVRPHGKGMMRISRSSICVHSVASEPLDVARCGWTPYDGMQTMAGRLRPSCMSASSRDDTVWTHRAGRLCGDAETYCSKFAAQIFQLGGRNDSGCCNPNGVELPVQLGRPESQEFVKDRKLRREIIFLPDITLQQHGMIRPMIENLGGRQPIPIQSLCERGHFSLSCPS
jgi:dihydroorotase